ncbi:MAG: universal stress protein [Bacteroidia bacterium]|nr:universal stress protein [Bacteroidia bacterium]NNC86615.1 universal stress protein [Bacteroidia bacterium]NNM15547.1 universal stress protein [Bacteroidia bacterium]
MKNILVLVDFTSTATISAKQTIAIAKKVGASVTFCHIDPSVIDEVKDSLKKQFEDYTELANQAGVESEVLVGHGELNFEVHEIVKVNDPDLVVVGTHGKVGLKQNLFGSSIYKLVKGIKASTLVVSDKTIVNEGKFKKVLMPVAPNKDYLLKVKQTCALLDADGEIVIFAIIKPGVPLFDEIVQNIESAKTFLERAGVKWKYEQVDSKHYSIGYARDTLEFVHEHDIDLVSIMTNVSEINPYFGSIDKENLILNDIGVPVLCANH